MSIDLKKLEEELRKKRCIICPYCGYEHELGHEAEMFEGHVTYWGEDIPKEFGCRACPEVFFIQEHVERTFEAKKTMEEFE